MRIEREEDGLSGKRGEGDRQGESFVTLVDRAVAVEQTWLVTVSLSFSLSLRFMEERIYSTFSRKLTVN